MRLAGSEASSPATTLAEQQAGGAAMRPGGRDAEKNAGEYDDPPIKFITFRVIMMGVLVSMGGLIFGFDTSQICGFWTWWISCNALT